MNAVIPRPTLWRPTPPALLEVTDVSEDSVTLSWLSPEHDGGSRVFRYIIEVKDARKASGWLKVKEVDSSDNLVTTVENLREGVPYLFRVNAENEVGAGPANELRETVVPQSHLGPPTSPEGPIRIIRVTRNMLAIHWQPPLDNGGSPIEKYIVQQRAADRSHWVQAGTCLPDVTAFCVTDLAENQLYYFRIMAQNAYGLSMALEFDKPVIPKRVFESAPALELESWLRESNVSAAESSHVLQRVSEQSERVYLAYADEALTSTSDALNTSLVSRF